MNKLAIAMLSAMLATGVSGQQFVYPAKGQSAEKQKTDEKECYSWAVKQTGYDPSKPVATPKPAPTAAPAAPAPQQAAPGGARLRGAAVGAAVAGITDHDVSDAAAVGAVAGASAQRAGKRQQAKAQQQATQQQQAAQQQQQVAQQQQAAEQKKTADANFQKAQAVCLEGRGYTVK